MLMPVETANKTPCIGPEGCGKYVDGERLCAAPRCMGWRWGEDCQVNGEGKFFNGRLVATKETGPLKLVHTGYCGLAGRP